ncbi:MAG TPA: hypothetical protein VLM05_22245 [Mycobacteriales bacterium]|nr:hypothetical protein [Mycobacteriales bacterium]
MDHRCQITTPGRRICDACLRGLRRDLAALPDLYDACAGAETRTAIQAVLTSWAALVATEWRTPAPGAGVPDLTAFLSRHGDWLACHGGAPLLVEDAAELVAAARPALQPA